MSIDRAAEPLPGPGRAAAPAAVRRSDRAVCWALRQAPCPRRALLAAPPPRPFREQEGGAARCCVLHWLSPGPPQPLAGAPSPPGGRGSSLRLFAVTARRPAGDRPRRLRAGPGSAVPATTPAYIPWHGRPPGPRPPATQLQPPSGSAAG